MKRILMLTAAFLTLTICRAHNGKDTYFPEQGALRGEGVESSGFSEDESTLIKKGDKLPAFRVQMLDGSVVNSAELKGKVVLINFWATWCGPCRSELARVQKEIIDRFGPDENFVLLMISRGETQEKVEQFRDNMGYKEYPFAVDPRAEVYSLFATKSIPRNFLVGPDGTVLESEIGYSPEAFDRLVADIEKALGKK